MIIDFQRERLQAYVKRLHELNDSAKRFAEERYYSVAQAQKKTARIYEHKIILILQDENITIQDLISNI